MNAGSPTPESRALEGCKGTPAILSDGATWLLHPGGLLNELDPLRDKLDDGARLHNQVEPDDVHKAAFQLLLANYGLDFAEAAALLDLDGPEAEQALSDAVFEALFGPAEPRKTFTTWAAASLMANGLDPASIPTAMLPHVLEILVGTGRTVPLGSFVDSAIKARKYAKIADFIDNQLERQAAAREAAANPTPTTIISGPGAGNNGP